MPRPFRRYCFSLAERLGFKSVKSLYKSLDNNEIAEWMAYDRTMIPEWVKEYEDNKEIERQKDEDIEMQATRIRKLLGGF